MGQISGATMSILINRSIIYGQALIRFKFFNLNGGLSERYVI